MLYIEEIQKEKIKEKTYKEHVILHIIQTTECFILNENDQRYLVDISPIKYHLNLRKCNALSSNSVLSYHTRTQHIFYWQKGF